jgi:two-component system CheB/CheR fusion protein
LLGVIQDITEQKLFAEELSAKVEERTKALKEANESLARSNEELEQFAYIASHDLQEPLRKIQLFNDLVLTSSKLDGVAKKYIQKVSDSAARMVGLIKDILNYSKLSEKNLQFELTDLNEISENVIEDYELTIAEKKAVITKGNLPVIEVIPLQMNQLFYNLIGNALKFTKDNTPPVISITSTKLPAERKNQLSELDTSRDYYEITVRDNGVGFNSEYADKIFTIFQQLHEKRTYGGYGIGLALCRKIVMGHGGLIFADSVPQQGAAFTFIIPEKQ